MGNLVKGYRTKYGNLEGVLANIVIYAPYVEYGTKRFSGRFYLKKGIELSMGKIESHFSKALDDVVVRISQLWYNRTNGIYRFKNNNKGKIRSTKRW